MYHATSKEMASLDEHAVRYGLEIRQMMEMAGHQIIHLMEQLEQDRSQDILILVGKGNKGGDGLCAARYLSNYGHKVNIILLSDQLSPDSRHHLGLVQRMNMGIHGYDARISRKLAKNADIIIDALIGYRLQGSPRGDYGEIIKIVNSVNAFKIAYDIPTGIEADGEFNEPVFKADATLTLGLPKIAFNNKELFNYTGDIYLGDIGIPEFIYDQISQNSKPDFRKSQNSLIKVN